MARISSDGKHFEVVAPTKRRKSESAGPTAAELNQAYREKSEQDQRVEKTKKDAAYTRKYLGAKKGIAAGAKQSYLDYQAGIQQDKGKLAQLNQDYEMTPTPELKQERDALAESIKRQENALTVYKKDYLDFEASEEALRQQYSSDQQTYQQAADDQKTFQSQYAALLNSYRGDDLEELSEEVRPEVQGVQELVYISVINQATDQISEIQKKKTEIEKRVAGTFSVDPDYANEANDQYFQDLDEWEELDQAEAFWRTQLFLAEGEKDRAHQKFEALKDPDFWKYVEKGNTFLQNQLNDSFGYYVPDSDQPDYTQAQIELERDRKSLAPIDQNMIAYYYGKDENGNRATPYMESLRREINESRTKSHLEDVQTVAQEHPVIAGIYSVPEKAIGRALVFGDMMEATTLPEERKGLLADPYTPGQSKLIGSDLARQTGLEQIDNPILKKGVEDVYSIADTAPAAVMSAVGMPGMGTAYLGAMRSADSYAKAAFRGATVEDALRQAKIDGAVSMFLGNRALRGTGSGQGGFSWQPGSATQQGVSMIPLNSGLLGEVPEAGAHALINQLGAQGAFQYLMENRGFSMDNALSRPSAQQAYHILKTEGLSPETSRYLLESNGYRLDDTSQLPDLLGDDTGEVLQRDEGLSGEMLELPKIGEEFKEDKKEVEKTRKIDTIERSEEQKRRDPTFEITGAAEDSHPEEIEKMKTDMENSGVEMRYGKGSIGYSPGINPGEPGQFHAAPGTSYSGWLHEYKHFCDDRANGFPGMRGAFTNKERWKQMEHDAYQLEIDLALDYGRPDIAEKLKILRDEEIAKI